DTGECHNYDKIHPSGRIYKIAYGKPKRVEVDLAKLSDEELVKLQMHENEWYARQGRRLLQERARAGNLNRLIYHALLDLIDKEKEDSRKLRAMWALRNVGELEEKKVLTLLDHPQEHIRGWAVRLFADNRRVSAEVAMKLERMARHD